VGIVLSAGHSLEDNWALRELGTVLLGSKNVYVTGRPDGYEDEILIHRDKNLEHPGACTSWRREPGPLEALVEDVGAGAHQRTPLALGAALPGIRRSAVRAGPTSARWRTLKLGSRNRVRTKVLSRPIATVLLPATSWAEGSGTYVQRQGNAAG